MINLKQFLYIDLFIIIPVAVSSKPRGVSLRLHIDLPFQWVGHFRSRKSTPSDQPLVLYRRKSSLVYLARSF